MKKETARIIKTAAIIIAIAAAAICYNGKWDVSPEVTELDCAADGDNDAAISGMADTVPDNVETAGGEETGRIFIHVCGEVLSPGVYELEEGSRIYQAVGMAGGLSENAAADFLNMAQVLEDGMKIQVPSREDLHSGVFSSALNEENIGTGAPAQSAGSGTSKVNLNSATKEQLMTLKGIGESRAEAIIAYREEYGPFSRIEDVMEVSGIKEAAFQKIKEDITV